MKIETLLYLFFIILTIVVPMLRKKKSAKAPVKPVNKPQTNDDDFFTTLQKQLEKLDIPILEEEKNKPVPQDKGYQPKSIQSDNQYDNYDNDIPEETAVDYENYEKNVNTFDDVKPDYYSYDDNYSQGSDSQTSPVVSQMAMNTVNSSDSESSRPDEKEDFHFDALTAVVYAEILKRPEY